MGGHQGVSDLEGDAVSITRELLLGNHFVESGIQPGSKVKTMRVESPTHIRELQVFNITIASGATIQTVFIFGLYAFQ